MRILLAALVLIGFNAYFLIEHRGIELLKDLNIVGNFEASKDFLLLILGLYLLIEAIALIIYRSRESKKESASEFNKEEIQDLQSRVPWLQTEVADLKKKLSQRSGEIESLMSERDSLSLALNESKTRLKKTEQEIEKKKRPQAIDAEIVNLLSLFQEKGRLVDFLMDDITPYGDAQVGAAARVVHQGCSSVLKEYFSVQPVHQGKEGEKMTLGSGVDRRLYRLVGRVSGEATQSGTVLHRGWKTLEMRVPRVTRDEVEEESNSARIIAPATVEV